MPVGADMQAPARRLDIARPGVDVGRMALPSASRSRMGTAVIVILAVSVIAWAAMAWLVIDMGHPSHA